MASKIQSHNFYVAITPYKVQGVEDQYNELSVFTSYNEHVHQFYVSLQAGWKSTFGHGSMIMGDSNPLTASTRVYVKESPRNSQKTINEIGGALELAKDIIAALFDDREWEKLKVVVQNVAKFGYTEKFKQQAEAYLKGRNKKNHESNESNESNNQTSEDKTMTENMKAADLIGKEIIIGGTSAKYIVKSIEGDKLQCDFVNDGKTTPMSVPVSQVEKFIAGGKWTVADATPTSSISHQPSDIKTEADVAEVDDIVPVVKPAKPKVQDSVPQPAPKSEEPDPDAVGELVYEEPKAKVEPIGKKSEGRSKMYDGRGKKEDVSPQTSNIKHQTSNIPQPSAIKHQTSYVYETYTSSKGKPCARILGFKETDAAYQNAADIHGSHSWITSKDGRVLYVAFGPKYAAKAKEVCDALNAGKSFEDCKAIMDGRTAGEAKTYSSKDVAEMLRKVLAGGDVPEDIKALMQAA